MTNALVLPAPPRARLLEIVRQFTPNWFGATMGTGILSVALAQFPEPLTHAAGEALWLADVGLFVLFAALYGARWLVYPHEAARIINHPVMAMYLGCIPMGLATIINGLVLYGRARFGPEATDLALVLWKADAVMALLCGVGVPFAMFTRQSHALERMTAVWLLPVVACEVAAASAATVAPTIADPAQRLGVIAAGYVLWGCSVPAALSILAILMLRLAAHKLPPIEMAASAWLPLGPIGMAVLGLVGLGGAAGDTLHGSSSQMVGEVARGVGLIAGLPLWGYGLWWMALAVLATLRHMRDGLVFNLGWWAYVFPIGVFAVATLRLASGLPLPGMTLIGQGLVLALAIVWTMVTTLTLRGALRGELFSAPCLIDQSRA